MWDDIILCLQSPESYPLWQYLFRVFDSHNAFILWFSGISLIICSMLLNYVSSEMDTEHIDFTKNFIYTFAVIFGIAVPIQRYCQRLVLRLHLSLEIIGTFWIISVYNALFIGTFLYEKHPPKIESLREVHEFGVTVSFPPEFSVSLFRALFL